MKPGLLALDFDGVVCDGVDEMVESAWRTLGSLGAPKPELDDGLRRRFAALRPAIESGWEMVVLVGLLGERPAERDAELRDGGRWAEARDTYVRAQGFSSSGLASSFDKTRLDWIDQDAPSWLARHRFYPGIADWLNRLQVEGHVVYVISTKSKPFLDALLAWQDVQVLTERVIGRAEPKREKWDVLRAIAAEHGVAPEDVWFVEDRLATLLEMRRHAPDFGARMFFAEWGYVFPDQDVPTARAAGIPVLTLAQATGPFEGWPSA